MSRKRAQLKNPIPKTTKKQLRSSKENKLLISTILISIFFFCLLLNAIIPYSTGYAIDETQDITDVSRIAEKYYYLGPDPYYNIRTLTETIKLGYYPYTDTPDPLLNYPIGNPGSRPPMFNMIALFSSSVLQTTGLSEVDSLGLATQFLPAIFGALLIFPVYGISKHFFGTKTALLSAFFISIIPIHITSGHGSAYALFDHDSFILLLSTSLTFFIFKSFKETDKTKSLLFSVISGVFLGAITLTWVSFYVISLSIAIFVFLFVYIDVIRQKYQTHKTFNFVILFLTSYLIALPYLYQVSITFEFAFLSFVFVAFVYIIHLLLSKAKLPWILTLPATIGVIGACFYYLKLVSTYSIPSYLYNPPILSISRVFFDTGIYGAKVGRTIAEGSTYSLSLTAMAIGPVLFWVALLGFLFFIYLTIRKKFQEEHTLFLTLFIINLILLSQAGRFINDIVPYMAIFSSYLIFLMFEKLHITTNVESKSFLYKKVQWYHILAPIGIVLVIFFPFIELYFIPWTIYFLCMLFLSTIPVYKILDDYNVYQYIQPTKVKN